jgi:SNF2 family DNA or RNA helicase
LGHDPSPKKLLRSQNKQVPEVVLEDSELQALKALEQELLFVQPVKDSGLVDANRTKSNSISNHNSTAIPNAGIQGEGRLNDDRQTKAIHDFLSPSQIISTASTKLSYLLDRIIMYQQEEKILVFYEDSNTAYYIAQYLECLNIKHLIYARELTPEKRSRYVATFNTTETFRVLLMDVTQAAFGLDVSSASRVYFINPVFSPQVEAQAVKRAHRIGQTRPVYVETLVLKGSIEEVLVARRNAVSKEEHQKFKSILDDQTVYDWIRNVNLLPMDLNAVSGPEQMAPLRTPQPAFGQGSGSGYGADPDAEIVKVHEDLSNGSRSPRKPAALNGGGLSNGTV